MVVTPQECARLTKVETDLLDKLEKIIDVDLKKQGLRDYKGDITVTLRGFGRDKIGPRVAHALETKYANSGWTKAAVVVGGRYGNRYNLVLNYDLVNNASD